MLINIIMPKEYEYAFLFDENIKEHDIKRKLKQMKEKHMKPMMFSIMVYSHPSNDKDIYIRLRDEGIKKTFTVKTKLGSKFVTELETTVDDIKIVNDMLIVLGCKLLYTVEKLREIWTIDYVGKEDVEVVFDSYPGLPTYMEIETDSEDKLNKFCKKLGLDPSQRYQGGGLYDELYGLPKNRKVGGNLTFKSAKKVFLKIITKNKKIFNDTLKKQQEYIDKYLT